MLISSAIHAAADGSAAGTGLLALDTDQLLSALPIGASIVVAARTLFGLRTIGVFAPVLLATGVLGIGLLDGMVMVAAAVIGAVVAIPLVDRLALPRIARLGLLLCAVCGALLVVEPGAADRAALPALTIAVIVERCWDTTAGDGWAVGARLIGATTGLAVVIATVLVFPPVARLLALEPALTVAVGAAAIVLAGGFRGLRFGERRRFRQLLMAEEVA